MLTWIWIYNDDKIKVEFAGRFYYLEFFPGSINTKDIVSIVRSKRILLNTSSIVDRWKTKEGVVYKDYLGVDYHTLLIILLTSVPKEERKDRERVAASSFGLNALPVHITRTNYMFFIEIPKVKTTMSFGKILPPRSRNKRIGNVKGWLMRSKPDQRAFCGWEKATAYPTYGPFSMSLSSLVWILDDLGEGPADIVSLIMFI